MPSAVNNNNINIKEVASAQPVGARSQQQPTADKVDKFKEFFNKDKGAKDHTSRHKNVDKEKSDTAISGVSGVGVPLGMFGTPLIGDTVSGISGAAASSPLEAALRALANETYAKALITRSEHVDGSLHIRVQNEQFAGVEIMVTLLGQDEKKRIGNEIHMQIWSKNTEQHAAFAQASKKLQGAKFSGHALNIDIKPVR